MVTKYTIPEIWSDLHHDLIPDTQGNVKKVLNVAAIYSSLHNILGTRKSERVMRPEFGSELWTSLFQSLDLHTTHYLSNSLKESVEAEEDRVIIQGIDFKSNPDTGDLEIVMTFQVRGYAEIFTFNKVVSG